MTCLFVILKKIFLTLRMKSIKNKGVYRLFQTGRSRDSTSLRADAPQVYVGASIRRRRWASALPQRRGPMLGTHQVPRLWVIRYCGTQLEHVAIRVRASTGLILGFFARGSFPYMGHSMKNE